MRLLEHLKGQSSTSASAVADIGQQHRVALIRAPKALTKMNQHPRPSIQMQHPQGINLLHKEMRTRALCTDFRQPRRTLDRTLELSDKHAARLLLEAQ